MALPAGEVSADLLAAQGRLAQLQEKSREERLAMGAPVDRVNHGRTPPPSPLQLPADLPDHLGWGSTALTAVARKNEIKRLGDWEINESAQFPRLIASQSLSLSVSQSPPTSSPTIKLYPDIAAGMFQRELTAPGRIWLLLRHLDSAERGWLDLEEVRAHLTNKQFVGRRGRDFLGTR